jgi:hypothetical protein
VFVLSKRGEPTHKGCTEPRNKVGESGRLTTSCRFAPPLGQSGRRCSQNRRSVQLRRHLVADSPALEESVFPHVVTGHHAAGRDRPDRLQNHDRGRPLTAGSSWSRICRRDKRTTATAKATLVDSTKPRRPRCPATAPETASTHPLRAQNWNTNRTAAVGRKRPRHVPGEMITERSHRRISGCLG